MRAADFANANGIVGFRANWDKLVSSIYNNDPPVRLVITRVNTLRKSLEKLQDKAMREITPLGEGLLIILPEARLNHDPRGFMVVLPMTDYLEVVARARRLVYDD